jgi:vitellogenic carboxypeptidase-like protein
MMNTRGARLVCIFEAALPIELVVEMKTNWLLPVCYCALFLPICCASPAWSERFRVDKRPISNFHCHSRCAGDAGEPLYLTPYIQSGRITEGRAAAAVKGLPGAGAAHGGFSGFLTVNATTDSNTFFWYFPPLNGNASAPTLLWLQGGPGSSSLFGLFYEIGPYFVTSDLNLVSNPNSWNIEHGLLFFDNPINTGFSFSSSDDGYARSSNDYSETLYEAIRQFYVLFPELQSNAFIITGESYAGKYVPAMALRIAQKNSAGSLPRVPLVGIAVGDGLVDPLNMVTGYPELVYQFGLADSSQKLVLESYATNFANAVKTGDNLEAYRQFDLMINGDTLGPSYYSNITQIGYFRCCSGIAGCVFAADGRCNDSILAAVAL